MFLVTICINSIVVYSCRLFFTDTGLLRFSFIQNCCLRFTVLKIQPSVYAQCRICRTVFDVGFAKWQFGINSSFLNVEMVTCRNLYSICF